MPHPLHNVVSFTIYIEDTVLVLYYRYLTIWKQKSVPYWARLYSTNTEFFSLSRQSYMIPIKLQNQISKGFIKWCIKYQRRCGMFDMPQSIANPIGIVYIQASSIYNSSFVLYFMEIKLLNKNKSMIFLLVIQYDHIKTIDDWRRLFYGGFRKQLTTEATCSYVFNMLHFRGFVEQRWPSG